MANEQHLAILRSGVEKWNTWRKDTRRRRFALRMDALYTQPDLSGANLIKASLIKADLSGVDLSKAKLIEANLQGANLSSANLQGANLTNAHLLGTDLSFANLSGACLNWAQMIGVGPGMTNLQGANLSSADLRWTDLAGVNLIGAYLTGAQLLKANLSGTYLMQANLSGTNLSGLVIFRALLTKANLSGAVLRTADLREATLEEADLRKADLGEADLRKADLRKADLRGASLWNTDLREANLNKADLSAAILINTRLGCASLDYCNIYGISAWNVQLDGATQTNLLITPSGEPEIRVDNLEVAQFLYMLLQNQKLRAVLDTIASKVVLILGRFSAERKPALDSLREALRNHSNGYIPVLFDFTPQQEKPVLDTVKTLANLARFVIADLTDPNMVRSELTYITANVPTVPICSLIEDDAMLPTEYATWERYQTFLPVYRYINLQQLLASLDVDVIAPVEKLVRPRRLDAATF